LLYAKYVRPHLREQTLAVKLVKLALQESSRLRSRGASSGRTCFNRISLLVGDISECAEVAFQKFFGGSLVQMSVDHEALLGPPEGEAKLRRRLTVLQKLACANYRELEVINGGWRL
jgi:hypothetical protein